MKHLKIISIDDFIKLWENIRKKKYWKFARGLRDNLADIWRETVLEQFEMMKREGSWGDQAEIMQNLGDYVRFISTLGFSPLQVGMPRKGYKSVKYAEAYPYAYRGRSDELLQEMQRLSTYNVSDRKGNLKITVTIPKKEGKEPDAYRWLEAKRSLVTASFVLAWPKMLREIMRSIG